MSTTSKRSPSFSNDIFHPRAAWLRNNRIRESPSGWHRARLMRFPNAAISYVVLKHEGNMPFENDGLRGGRKSRGQIIFVRFVVWIIRGDFVEG